MATQRIVMTVLTEVTTGKIMEEVLKYSCKFSFWFAEGNRKVTCPDKSDIRYLISEHPVFWAMTMTWKNSMPKKNVSIYGVAVLFRYTYSIRQNNTGNVVCFLLGNSTASKVYMPTFRNTLSVPYSYAGRCRPTYLWRWDRKSVPKRRHIKFRRRENYPKENIQHTDTQQNFEINNTGNLRIT